MHPRLQRAPDSYDEGPVFRGEGGIRLTISFVGRLFAADAFGKFAAQILIIR